MSALRFTKMQGLGNDFVVVDATREPFVLSASQIRRLADRRFGVGCDQVLVVERPRAPLPHCCTSPPSALKMR